MSEYHLEGGQPLTGTIKISGAKNAALKLMAAALLTNEEVILENIPLIEDVFTMAEALRSLGAKVELSENKAFIRANNLTNCTAPYDLVSKMRASILVMGPLLAKLGRSKAAMPGGCKIGLRKIDFHIKGLEALGAEISLEHGYIDAKASRLEGCQIQLDFPSVGATENLLMAAVLAKGQTVIKNAAREPEIVDLANFLNKIGAKVKGAGTTTLTIQGVKRLAGGSHKVISDRIEAGTFLVAGALFGKNLQITNIEPKSLSIVLKKLSQIGADLSAYQNSILINRVQKIRACNLVTLPHPGFPTDLQGPFMALLCLAQGQSVITENVFESRFLLAEELKKMGANINIDGHRALIRGIPALKGCLVEAPDLRGGSSLVIAGLSAEGITKVTNIEHIDRGYENFEEKLTSVGVRIRRVEATSDFFNRKHQFSFNG